MSIFKHLSWSVWTLNISLVYSTEYKVKNNVIYLFLFILLSCPTSPGIRVVDEVHFLSVSVDFITNLFHFFMYKDGHVCPVHYVHRLFSLSWSILCFSMIWRNQNRVITPRIKSALPPYTFPVWHWNLCESWTVRAQNETTIKLLKNAREVRDIWSVVSLSQHQER